VTKGAAIWRYSKPRMPVMSETVTESRHRTPATTGSEQSVKLLERGVDSSPNVALDSTKYFDRWYHLLTNSSFKGYYRYVARKYEPKFAKCGYSLTKDSGK
jgi:hypothetical protein